MDISNHIEVNPKILMGKPVIKGTRISVEQILEKLRLVKQKMKYSRLIHTLPPKI